jgi:hypothetical protein
MVPILLYSCQGSDASSTEDASGQFRESDEFQEYWKGRTEVNSYEVKSNSGQTRGLVMIFEVEPFSRRKYVKLHNPDQAGDDLVNVIRLSMVKQHDAEVVSNSLMQSVFTPLDRLQFPNSTKLTFSSHRAEGQTFIQMRLFNNSFRISSHSYIADIDRDDFNIHKVLLEDELWNIVRTNYSSLPKGKFQIMPSMFFIHATHRGLTPLVANGNLIEMGSTMEYSLQYTHPNRRLTITFDSKFPYTIRRWTEYYEDESGNISTTSGTLINPDGSATQQSEVSRDSLALDSIR